MSIHMFLLQTCDELCSISNTNKLLFILLGGDIFSAMEFGEGRGPIFLDYLQCEGHEEKLVDCPSLYFLSQCSHAEDVGIRCNG